MGEQEAVRASGVAGPGQPGEYKGHTGTNVLNRVRFSKKKHQINLGFRRFHRYLGGMIVISEG